MDYTLIWGALTTQAEAIRNRETQYVFEKDFQSFYGALLNGFKWK